MKLCVLTFYESTYDMLQVVPFLQLQILSKNMLVNYQNQQQ